MRSVDNPSCRRLGFDHGISDASEQYCPAEHLHKPESRRKSHCPTQATSCGDKGVDTGCDSSVTLHTQDEMWRLRPPYGGNSCSYRRLHLYVS
jgi:hypothetical protein